MSRRKKQNAGGGQRSRKAKARAARGEGSHGPSCPQLLTAREMAGRLRRLRSGITAVFDLNQDGTLADTVFLYDAQYPTLSRRCHMLDIEKLLNRPLDPHVAKIIAKWRAEQGGARGSA